MAGEWIKMRIDLADDPAVIRIRRATGIDADGVVGKLHRLWSWADAHTTDGFTDGLDAEWVDEFVGCHGFAEAMTAAGWLASEEGGIRFANFDRHNGKPAKARALGKNRMKRIRCAGSATVAQPEKRREEKKKDIPAAPVAPTETRKPRSRSQPTDSIRWTPAAGWEGITAEDRAAWAAAYPACDVARELAAAGEWLRANPEKARKSRWRSFLVRWLSRSQDRGGGKPSNRPGAPPPAKAWAERPSWRDDACRNLTDAQYREWLKTQKRSQEPQGAVRGVAVPPADSVDPF